MESFNVPNSQIISCNSISNSSLSSHLHSDQCNWEMNWINPNLLSSNDTKLFTQLQHDVTNPHLCKDLQLLIRKFVGDSKAICLNSLIGKQIYLNDDSVHLITIKHIIMSSSGPNQKNFPPHIVFKEERRLFSICDHRLSFQPRLSKVKEISIIKENSNKENKDNNINNFSILDRLRSQSRHINESKSSTVISASLDSLPLQPLTPCINSNDSINYNNSKKLSFKNKIILRKTRSRSLRNSPYDK